MILAQLGKLWSSLSNWWYCTIDPIAATLPLPQALILITLESQLRDKDVHYDDLYTAEQLYERLSSFSRGEWYQFVDDLDILNQRTFISWNGGNEDRVLISPRGLYLARERMKNLYGD